MVNPHYSLFCGSDSVTNFVLGSSLVKNTVNKVPLWSPLTSDCLTPLFTSFGDASLYKQFSYSTIQLFGCSIHFHFRVRILYISLLLESY